MVVGIVIVGWLVGAVSVTVALLAGDPGFLGALGLFIATSVAGCIAAALSLAMRSGSPDSSPADLSLTPSRNAARAAPRPAAGLTSGAVHSFSTAARVPAPMAEAGFQRPS
jgi:hypothetical protein